MIQVIKLGERSCLLAKKCCIPYDSIVSIEFVWDDKEILYALIFTLIHHHVLPADESIQLYELLQK